MAALSQLVNFHAIGEWSQPQLQCAWTESSFNPPPTVKVEIEEVWQKLAQRPGVNLFDGPMCRLERFSIDGGNLSMVISEVSYKNFAGTNMHNPQFATEHGADAMANPLGISVALISRDQKLVLGRRNERVAYYPGRIHPFAGALEPSDALNIFSAVRRELNEELRLAETEINDITCLGLAEDRSLLQPELIVHAQSTKSVDEMRQGLDAQEHETMVAIELTEKILERELTSSKLYTPIALATLLLCGRHRFGSEWFDGVYI